MYFAGVNGVAAASSLYVSRMYENMTVRMQRSKDLPASLIYIDVLQALQSLQQSFKQICDLDDRNVFCFMPTVVTGSTGAQHVPRGLRCWYDASSWPFVMSAIACSPHNSLSRINS